MSPVRVVTDSCYSLVLSENLLKKRAFTLDEYFRPPLNPGEYPGAGSGHVHAGSGSAYLPYQLETAGGHIYYWYPPGSSILSLPFVASMNYAGIRATDANNKYNAQNETLMQCIIASVLAACFTAIMFLAGRCLLPIRWSLLAALSAGFGTQIWSTASRALHTHTWLVLLQGCVVLVLIVQEVKQRETSPFLLGTLLSWMYFTRPTGCIPIVFITLYILMFHRGMAIRLIGTGAVWLALFELYSFYHFGWILPSYYLYGSEMQLATLLHQGLAGSLFSPSRGLFVFVPTFAFILLTTIMYWRRLRYRRLAALSLAIIAGYILACSAFGCWWGGHSYGPRLLTDTVPWFMLLGILGLRALLDGCREAGSRLSRALYPTVMAVGIILLGLGIFINGRGAFSYETWLWNVRPVDINQDLDRLWSWKDPQFLAGLVPLPQSPPS